MGIVLFWFALGVAVAVLASNRGRSGFAWFLISLVISPLLGFIFILVMENLAAKQTLVVQASATLGESTPEGAYSGDPVLSNDSYKIYLTKRYSIQKNDVLGKYVIDEKLFPDIDSAIEFTNARELTWIDRRAKQREYDRQHQAESVSYKLGKFCRKYPFAPWVVLILLISVVYFLFGNAK